VDLGGELGYAGVRCLCRDARASEACACDLSEGTADIDVGLTVGRSVESVEEIGANVDPDGAVERLPTPTGVWYQPSPGEGIWAQIEGAGAKSDSIIVCSFLTRAAACGVHSPQAEMVDG